MKDSKLSVLVDGQNGKVAVRVKFEMSIVGKKARDGFFYRRQDSPDQPVLQDSSCQSFFSNSRKEKTVVWVKGNEL